jgi:hypothetical protein
MILPKVGKLVAFHPMGATKTLFGYFLKEENAKWVLDIDGKITLCETKYCTVVYDKKNPKFREV